MSRYIGILFALFLVVLRVQMAKADAVTADIEIARIVIGIKCAPAGSFEPTIKTYAKSDSSPQGIEGPIWPGLLFDAYFGGQISDSQLTVVFPQNATAPLRTVAIARLRENPNQLCARNPSFSGDLDTELLAPLHYSAGVKSCENHLLTMVDVPRSYYTTWTSFTARVDGIELRREGSRKVGIDARLCEMHYNEAIGNPQQVIEWLRKQPSNGGAMVKLADYYARGFGVKKDEEEAAQLWKTAAELGNRDALQYLWHYYENKNPPDYKEAYFSLVTGGDLDEVVCEKTPICKALQSHLTKEEIAEAQKRRQEWKPQGQQ